MTGFASFAGQTKKDSRLIDVSPYLVRAERVGFEPTVPCGTPVFETGVDLSQQELQQVDTVIGDVCLQEDLQELAASNESLRQICMRWPMLPKSVRETIQHLVGIY